LEGLFCPLNGTAFANAFPTHRFAVRKLENITVRTLYQRIRVEIGDNEKFASMYHFSAKECALWFIRVSLSEGCSVDETS